MNKRYLKRSQKVKFLGKTFVVTNPERFKRIRNKIRMLGLAVFVTVGSMAAVGIAKDYNKINNMNKSSISISMAQEAKTFNGNDIFEKDKPNLFGFITANKLNQEDKIGLYKKGYLNNDAITDTIIDSNIGIDDNGQLDIRWKLPAKLINYLENEKDQKTLLMITNFPDEHSKKSPSQLTELMFKNQDLYIKELINFTKDSGSSGVVIDFEVLKDNQEKQFTQFMTKLKQKFVKEKLYVGASVHLRFNENMNKAYNYNEIAKNSDVVFIMAYDVNPNKARPLITNEEMRKNIKYVVDNVEKQYIEKIVYAFAAYARVYGKGKASVSYDIINQTIEHGNNARKGFDEKGKFAYYKYISPRLGKSIGFYENAKSLLAKIDEERKNGIPINMAIWSFNKANKEFINISQEILYYERNIQKNMNAQKEASKMASRENRQKVEHGSKLSMVLNKIYRNIVNERTHN